jgi:hypothetical protein
MQRKPARRNAAYGKKGAKRKTPELPTVEQRRFFPFCWEQARHNGGVKIEQHKTCKAYLSPCERQLGIPFGYAQGK